jgi:copper chaperone
MKLKVDEMSCGHCAAAVTKAVESVPGGAKADIDLVNGEVTVTGTTDTAAVIAAITDAGYSASELA